MEKGTATLNAPFSPSRSLRRMLTGATMLAGVSTAIGGGTALAQSASGADADTIVVTAQKREQRLIEVPAAVSVIGGEVLNDRGYTRLEDIVRLTPNFGTEQTQDARAVRLSIRGIGADPRFPGAEQSVSIVLDGVPLSGSAGLIFDLVDIEQIEILRGPQGTLFGRNAAAGVVNIRTRKPDDTPTAFGSVEVGNFDRIAARGSFSGPIISDKLYGLVGISHTQRDGFSENTFSFPAAPGLTNDVDDQNTTTVRGSLVFTPDEATEFVLTGDYTAEERAPSAPDADDDPFDRVLSFDTINRAERDIFGVALTAERAFDDLGFSLKAIGSYREYEIDETLDGDFGPNPFLVRNNNETSEEFTAEIQILSNTDGPLTWIAGAYFLDQTLINDGVYPLNQDLLFGPNLSYRNALAGILGLDGATIDAICLLEAPDCLGTASPNVIFNIGIQSIAGFGQATYALTDRLDITAGLRYSDDKRDYSYNALNEEAFFRGFGTGPAIAIIDPPLSTSRNDSNLDWKAALNYEFSPSLSVYGSVATGYKAGAFATQVLDSPEQFLDAEVDAEESINYEVGVKAFFDGVQFAASVFYIDYENFQTDQQAQGSIPGVPETFLGNADVESFGFELEGVVALSSWLDFLGSVGFVDSEFSDYPSCQVLLDPDTFVETAQDCDGNRIPYIPKWTAAATLDLNHPLGGGKMLRGFVSASYKSEQFFTPLNEENLIADAYTILDAQLGVEFRDGQVGAYLWGRNLADEEYSVRSRVTDPSNTGGFGVNLSPPRTWGGRLVFRY